MVQPRRACIQNNQLKNPCSTSTYRVDLFLWVNSKSRLFQCRILENRTGFLKRVTFTMAAVQRKRGTSIYPLKMPTAPPPPTPKGESTYKKIGVSAPNPPKLCLWIRLKKVDSLRLLFPAFIYFEYRWLCSTFLYIIFFKVYHVFIICMKPCK